jgi:hypothetical protein
MASEITYGLNLFINSKSPLKCASTAGVRDQITKQRFPELAVLNQTNIYQTLPSAKEGQT